MSNDDSLPLSSGIIKCIIAIYGRRDNGVHNMKASEFVPLGLSTF
jgi:hypothetical protein